MEKYPFILQHDSMQCGVACLAMICRYYGKEYSLESLSHICGISNKGVSLLGISKAAQNLGFTTMAGYVSLGKLKEAQFPCILHWNQNHFVVLYRVKKDEYYVADPSKGVLIYTKKDFQKYWLTTQESGEDVGIAMFLQPNFNINRTHKNLLHREIKFKYLLGYLQQYRKYFILIFIGLFLGSILQLLLPFLMQAIVDIGIRSNNVNIIWLILLGELMIVIGRTAMDFNRRWLLLHISMRINISLVSDFFIKLLKLPMSFFDTKLMGDLLQRMNDHNRVERFLTTHLLNIAFSLLSFLVFGYVLFFYNRMIFGIFLLGSILYALWISFFLKRRKILDYELFEKQAENNNKTYQFITTMQEIKLQDCEQRRRWEWEDIQADLFAVQMKSLKLQQTQEAGSIFINEVKNIVITVIAATAVINGQMTLGMMLAVQYIIGQLNSPVEQLMNFIYSLQDVKISLERINEVHMAKEEERENLLTHYQSEIKTISLKDVAFKYDPHAPKNTLEHISFQIPAGKVTAIVGASGSGKTTLIKLMLGYYPVTAGSISIADENINNYNLKWWRKQCGVVMQDGVIFSESIARNIAVDDGEVDIQKLEEAAKIANIHDYIMKLPLKYNTLIGRDGVGLSQGQKQRILIARAVYRNPSFIFLDEATNALDAKNEKVIIENLNKFYQGRTVIVVAHRLSTVKNADQIIVLDNGKIAEIGNHVSLIEKQGLYYNLVRNQLELGN